MDVYDIRERMQAELASYSSTKQVDNLTEVGELLLRMAEAMREESAPLAGPADDPVDAWVESVRARFKHQACGYADFAGVMAATVDMESPVARTLQLIDRLHEAVHFCLDEIRALESELLLVTVTATTSG